MQSIILITHVLASVCIIALVLVQHGKGADAGAAFGSGASNTMFGSQGPMPFLVKLTALFVTIFFITSISLSYLAAHFTTSPSQILTTPTQSGSESSSQPSQSSVVLNIPTSSPSEGSVGGDSNPS